MCVILPATGVLAWKVESRRLGLSLGAPTEDLCATEELCTYLGHCFIVESSSKCWEAWLWLS